MTDRRGTSKRVGWLAKTLITVFSTALCASESRAAPTISETGATRYLEEFGYLQRVNSTSGEIVSEETLASAISEFQSSSGIDVTGNLDGVTTRLMTMSRCGNADKDPNVTHTRSKRYALLVKHGLKRPLTYKVFKYSTKLSPDTVDETMAKAFGIWMKHADLNITEALRGRPDIWIWFERRDHQCENPFDGPLTANGGFNTLAHAWSVTARHNGAIHFDDDEQWNQDNYLGVSLLRVAVHEIGHVLGLDHSSNEEAIMYAHNRRDLGAELHQDDINGIQRLYGKKPRREYRNYDVSSGVTPSSSSATIVSIFNRLLLSSVCLLCLRHVIQFHPLE